MKKSLSIAVVALWLGALSGPLFASVISVNTHVRSIPVTNPAISGPVSHIQTSKLDTLDLARSVIPMTSTPVLDLQAENREISAPLPVENQNTRLFPATAESPVIQPPDAVPPKLFSGGPSPVRANRMRRLFAELKAEFRIRQIEELSSSEGGGFVKGAVGVLAKPSLSHAKTTVSVPPIPAPPAMPKGRLTRLATLFWRFLFPSVLVSGCLLSLHVRYDGKDLRPNDRLSRLFAKGRVVVICPEVEGGLQVPREPASIKGGTGADVLDGRARVLTRSGRDVTEAYLRGAYAALAKAQAAGCREAYLKTRSPSCGINMGVTAALLERHGIKVIAVDSPRA